MLSLGRVGLPLALLAFACGGRSTAFDEPLGGGTAGAPEAETSLPPAPSAGTSGSSAEQPDANPTPATPPSAPPVPFDPPGQPEPEGPADTPPPDPPLPDPCVDTELSVEAEWFTGGYYGLDGPGLLSFSPDGARLVTFGDQYDHTLDAFDAMSGALLEHVELEGTFYARDPAWRIDLRGREETDGALHAVETESGKLVADLTPNDATVVGAAISRDGRYAGVLACRGGELVVARHGLFDAEATELTTGSCPPFHEVSIFQLVEQGTAALYVAGDDPSLKRVDFARGEVTSVTLHPLAEYVPAVTGLALSPDETVLVSAGALDARIFRYPDFSPLFDPVPVVAQGSFNGCYVSTRFLSALAWSPDGRFVAMPAPGGRLAIRRTCDLELLVELEPEGDVLCSHGEDGAPAILAAFSPAGDRIAVSFSGALGVFRLF
jgi:hypothetical protein